MRLAQHARHGLCRHTGEIGDVGHRRCARCGCGSPSAFLTSSHYRPPFRHRLTQEPNARYRLRAKTGPVIHMTAVKPPSTYRIWPLTKFEADEAKNTADPIRSGRPCPACRPAYESGPNCHIPDRW